MRLQCASDHRERAAAVSQDTFFRACMRVLFPLAPILSDRPIGVLAWAFYFFLSAVQSLCLTRAHAPVFTRIPRVYVNVLFFLPVRAAPYQFLLWMHAHTERKTSHRGAFPVALYLRSFFDLASLQSTRRLCVVIFPARVPRWFFLSMRALYAQGFFFWA